MRVTITARHAEIDDDLRAHAQDLVEKVAKLVRRPHHAQVVFTDDHGEAEVEIEVHAPRARSAKLCRPPMRVTCMPSTAAVAGPPGQPLAIRWTSCPHFAIRPNSS